MCTIAFGFFCRFFEITVMIIFVILGGSVRGALTFGTSVTLHRRQRNPLAPHNLGRKSVKNCTDQNLIFNKKTQNFAEQQKNMAQTCR